MVVRMHAMGGKAYPVTFGVSRLAARFVARHGGRVYVWLDEHRFLHASHEQPPNRRFTRHADATDQGVAIMVCAELRQKDAILAPLPLRIGYAPLPRPHLTATWPQGMDSGGA